MKIIDRGIFQTKTGYWWAWSMVKPGYVSSLRTKDKAKAQRIYDKRLRELREYDQQYGDKR